MGFLGGYEWLIIILVLLLFFGARKIPDMARGIGRGMFEFRKAVSEGEKEMKKNQGETEGERDGNGDEQKNEVKKGK